MIHWIEVGKDIWSFLRWVVPPFMFWLSGAISEEDSATSRFSLPSALFIVGLGYIGYASALLGRWS